MPMQRACPWTPREQAQLVLPNVFLQLLCVLAQSEDELPRIPDYEDWVRSLPYHACVSTNNSVLPVHGPSPLMRHHLCCLRTSTELLHEYRLQRSASGLLGARPDAGRCCVGAHCAVDVPRQD